MRYPKFKTFLLMFIILLSSSNLGITIETTVVLAGSPSSGDIPPPTGSGGDTGGGSAAGGLYLNYRIPLIFRYGPFGPSLISINSIQNDTYILFDFNSTQFPEMSTVINIGETLILDPSQIPELKNGSMIQAFTPLQITVYHNSETSLYDDTYSYSVLVMSMWGRIYQSPYDNMRAMIVAGYNNTEIDVNTPGEDIEYLDIPLIGETLEIDVSKDTIIEANGPIGVVFYSVSEIDGSFTYTGIPSYLWGTDYYVYYPQDTSLIPLLDGNIEFSVSAVGLGENIHSITNLYQDYLVDIPDNGSSLVPNSYLTPGEYYRNFQSIFTNFSLTVMYNYTYDGTVHKAAVGYVASDKMKWAELFYTNFQYSNIEEVKAVVLSDATPIVPILLIGQELYFDMDNYTELNTGNYFSYGGYEYLGFIGNGSFFSFLETAVPESSDWNSSANLLFPLNLYSYFDNTSTFFPSWYRFPNINVKEIVVSPSKPTEFRRLQLDVFVQNNGSIPSAPFWVTIYVNDSLKINTMLDGIDINESIPILYEEFQGFGLKVLNVSIFTDSQNQIFELAEFDNALEFFLEITRNWNIIYTGIAIAVIVIGVVSYFAARRIIKQRRKNRSRFDVILSEIEV